MDKFDNITDRVDYLLSLRNIPRKQLAEDLQVNVTIFSQWKKRNSVPNSLLAIQMAQYLGVTVEYLITGNESDNKIPNDIKTIENKLLALPENQRKLVIVSLLAQVDALQKIGEQNNDSTTAAKDA